MKTELHSPHLPSLPKLLLALALGGTLASCRGSVQTWTGEISDAMCAGDHASMGGADSASCSRECVETMRSKYVLVVENGRYLDLSDQASAGNLAGRKVQVDGKLDAGDKVIQVQSIQVSE